MTADDVRARFEALAVEKGLPPLRGECRDYADDRTQIAWTFYRAAHADLSGEVRELVRASQAMLDGLAVAEPAKRSLFQELRAALAKFTQEKP